MGCVVDYSPISILAPELTLDAVMSQLAADNKLTSSSSSATSSPARKNASTVEINDKKNMPKLGMFSGLDEDYFSWKDTVILMGEHGFSLFLTNTNEVAQYPHHNVMKREFIYL